MSEALSLETIDDRMKWALVKDAVCELGLSQREAADRYQVSYDALRKRCSREEWPIPAKVQEAVSQLSQNRLIATARAETWAERGENHRSRVFEIAAKALGDVEKSPPLVEGWADVERIDKMARRAAGLDNDETKVSNTFNFAMLGEDNDTELKSVQDVSQGELPDCSTP